MALRKHSLALCESSERPITRILIRRTDEGAGITVAPEDLHLPETVMLACNMCGFPVIILQTGAAVHASAADGMFCEMMYPN